LAGTGNSPPKPIRRWRTDRQEIGWYGFAAQRGCTHIIASAGTDRPTSYRMKDPARSVALRQQRNLAVRGASGMLEHSALLFRSGRIRTSPIRASGSYLGCLTAKQRAVRGSAPGVTRFRLWVRCVLCWSAFPLAPALGSTASATDSPALFGGFAATMAESDFSESCIGDYGSSPSHRGPSAQ
jgi:hypothetical protein